MFNHPENAKPKVSFSLSSIPYSTIEARYAVENALFEAIRRGDISEATYQQNLFMGFTLDQRISDPLQDARYMLVAVNTFFARPLKRPRSIRCTLTPSADGSPQRLPPLRARRRSAP